MNRNLYLVTEGQASLADASAEYDGVNSILVLAYNEADAVDVADAYDRGEVEAGNKIVEGETVACVWWDKSPAARKVAGPPEIEVEQVYGGWRSRLSDEADEDGGGWATSYPRKTRAEAEEVARDYAYRSRGLRL